MTEDWKKITPWFARTIVVGLFGIGGSQLLGGEWLGRLIFMSYAKALSLHIFNAHHIGAELYENWATQIVVSAQSGHAGPREIAVVVLLLALVGHVVAKSSVCDVAASNADSTTKVLPRIKAKVITLYRRFYHAVTLGTFFSLLVSLMVWVSSSFQLLAIYLLIVVPILLYVWLHSKDIAHVDFWERFMPFALLAILSISSFFLPQVFGSKMFDLSLRPIEIPKANRRRDVKAVRLLFDERQGVIGDIFYNDSGQLVVEFLKQVGKVATKGTPTHVSLKEIALKARPRRATAAEAAQIIGAVFRARQ